MKLCTEKSFNNPLIYIFVVSILASICYEMYSKNKLLAIFVVSSFFIFIFKFKGNYIAIILILFFTIFIFNNIWFYQYIPDNIEGLDVIIVDDIMDTGYTMEFVINHVKKLGAKSVKTCVLLDKPSRRRVELVPDYCGFTIEDKFVVGYGLNYGDHYRNIPYVFVVTDKDR